MLLLSTGSLVADEPAINVTVQLVLTRPELERQSQSSCGGLPLAEDGGAVAEHHSMLESALLLHRLEGQQCAQGFAGSRTCVDEHITGCMGLGLQPSAQQLNELLLPFPWANGVTLGPGSKGERRCVDCDAES